MKIITFLIGSSLLGFVNGQTSQVCTQVKSDKTQKVPCPANQYCISVLPMCVDSWNQTVVDSCAFQQGAVLGCVSANQYNICSGEAKAGSLDASQRKCPYFYYDPTNSMAVLSAVPFKDSQLGQPDCIVRNVTTNGITAPTYQCVWVFQPPTSGICSNGYSMPPDLKAKVCTVAENCRNPDPLHASDEHCGNPKDNTEIVHGACVPPVEGGDAQCRCTQFTDNTGKTYSFSGGPPEAPSFPWCYQQCTPDGKGGCSTASSSSSSATNSDPFASKPTTKSSSPSSSTTTSNTKSTTTNTNAQPASKNVAPAESNNSSSKGGFSTGAIIGTAVGGAVGLAIIVAIVVVVIKRRKQNEDDGDDDEPGDGGNYASM